MTKRKASTSAAKSAMKQDTTFAIDQAQADAMIREHRQYLIDINGGFDATPLPAKKKAKKSITKITEPATPITDASGEADVKSPAKGGVSAKLAKPLSKKRKAKDPSSPDSLAISAGEQAKHDSPTEVDSPPSAKKQKRADSKAFSPPAEPKIKAKAEPKSKPKAKSTSKAESTSKTKPKSRHKAKVEKHGEDTEDQPQPQPQLLAPLSQTVLAKIKQVKEFTEYLASRSHGSLLEHDPTNPSRIHMTEIYLMSVIMIMRADYEISDPTEDFLPDVEDIVVDRFLKAVPQEPEGQAWNWVTIDLTLPFALGEIIQAKLSGHGVEEINLLEVEAEMFERFVLNKKLGEKLGETVFPMDESKAFFDEVWQKIQAGAKGAIEAEVEQGDALLLTTALEPEEELPSVGVCPARPFEVV